MSLIKVKVIDSQIDVRNGISKAGKAYELKTQSHVLVELNGEVRLVSITLQDNHPAYAPGNYTLDPIELIVIGRFGFEFNRFEQIKLVPVLAAGIPKVG
jgi:Helix-destabilising protein